MMTSNWPWISFRCDSPRQSKGMKFSRRDISATTSLIVPLAGTGVLSLKQIFPYTLGANVGTTFTAILASFSTGSPAALTVALAHLTFNIFAIMIYYPLGAIPMGLAKRWGVFAARSKASTASVLGVYVALHLIPLTYIIWTAQR